MAEPSFLSFGDTPHRQDTKWTAAVRWLGQLQNQAGSDPENNPRRTDSYRDVLYKIARTATVDTDFSSFISRAGLTDETQIAAVKALVTAAKAHGWWDICDLIYPFVGGNATAHAQNLKSSGFDITWNGTVTHNANGVTGDGTTGYGQTGYLPETSGQMTLNGIHFSTYMRVAGSTSRRDFGCNDGVNGLEWLTGSINTSRMNFVPNNATPATAINSLDANFKLTAGTRRNATNVFGYCTTVGERTSASVSIGFPVAVELYVLALNTSGVASQFQDKGIAFLTAGSAIASQAVFNLMAADVQQFQTALGRQV